MEYFLFPKKSYYLTQGYGKGCLSHKNVIALDVSAAGGGSKEIFAPFTGYVARIFVKSNFAYTIWLVSNEKVICADGTTKYAVAAFTHPSEIKNFKVGDKFKQGDLLMSDGNTGFATGKHLHLETAVYDNKNDIIANWKQYNGDWGLINEINPCDCMVLSNDCKVINEIFLGKTYHFKRQSEVIYKINETSEAEYFKVGNAYKLLYDKCLRKTPEIVDTNILPFSSADRTSREKYLVQGISQAKVKKGVLLTPLNFAKDSFGRIYGSYGNCWVCLQNKDGSKQAEKYKTKTILG